MYVQHNKAKIYDSPVLSIFFLQENESGFVISNDQLGLVPHRVKNFSPKTVIFLIDSIVETRGL